MSVYTIAGVLRVFTNERVHYSRRVGGCLPGWLSADQRDGLDASRYLALDAARAALPFIDSRRPSKNRRWQPVTQHMHCTQRTPLAFQQRIRTPHYSPCATQILSCYLLTSFVVIFANSKRCICQAAAVEKRCCWCFACPATPESIAGQHK